MLGWSCGSGERCRYRQNWLVIEAYCSLIGVSYFISLPSLHQFVTSSDRPEDSDIQPGLGLSETWYSWVVSMQSLGELTGAILFSLLLKWCYTKHLMLVALVLCAGGGLLFGIGKYGWMLLIGRYLIGVYQGALMTILRIYIGETSSAVIASMPPERRARSTLKYTTFFITFSICTVSVLLGPGIAAIVAQIPSIDQFRWPGYFILLHAVVLGVVTVLGFREKKEDLCRESRSIRLRDIPIPLYTIACLMFAFFVINWYFAVIETLLNPVLGDNFGFDVEFNSYVFVGTLLFFASGTFGLYTMQRLHIDNRIICLLGLLLALCGSLIASDWQAIRGDPCDQFSKTKFYTNSNSSINSFFNTSYDNVVISTNASSRGSISSSTPESAEDLVYFWCQVDTSDYRCTAAEHGINLVQCEATDSSNTSTSLPSTANSSCICEALSHSPHHCFWNPHSRVTGRECQRCEELCRSRDRSLNLAQFLVGVSLASFAVPLGRITITLIVSDAMAAESQVLIMGILVAVGSLARFTGPLWGNAAYLAVNHRVYLVMNVLTVSVLLALLPYVILYRSMKPPQRVQLDCSNSLATSEFNTASDFVAQVEGHKTLDTEDLTSVALQQIVHIDDRGAEHVQRVIEADEVSQSGQRKEEGKEGGGKTVGGRRRTVDSDRVSLLSNMELEETDFDVNEERLGNGSV